MALPAITGTLDEVNGIVVPNDSGTWATAPSSWDAWTSWNFAPADPLVWLTDVIDLDTQQDFTLDIATVANGEVSYDVYTSNTGAFNGEETLTAIAHGASAVSAFNGRYVIVAVKVTVTAGLNILESVRVTSSNRTVDIKLNAVDTSTLTGTASARQLVLPRTPSKVVHMQITPQEITAYTVDQYVTAYPTSKQLIPRIVSRTAPVTIALGGRDGVDRDGVCDILLSVLPEQFMSGNDLKTR